MGQKYLYAGPFIAGPTTAVGSQMPADIAALIAKVQRGEPLTSSPQMEVTDGSFTSPIDGSVADKAAVAVPDVTIVKPVTGD